MKKLILLLIIILPLFNYTNRFIYGDDSMEDWQLVFEDNFNEINTDIWKFEIGNGHPRNPGWGNNELQYYTEDNAYIENGYLVIEAKKEKKYDSFGSYNYTSSRIKTQNNFKFKYGKVEVRAKFPFGKGLWPAIWLLGSNITYVGWPLCGEIDIVEFLGHDKYSVYGTVHGPGYSGSKGISRKYTDYDKNFVDNFHTFGIEWDENQISFLVDGNVYSTVKKEILKKRGLSWVFDNNFFLIVNLAVGGNWPGYPDYRTKFPAKMYVDYIKVWQKKEK
jgi:beta-glucanase (GH16 family)